MPLSRLVAMPALPIPLIPTALSIEFQDKSSSPVRMASNLYPLLASLRALLSLPHQSVSLSSPRAHPSKALRVTRSLLQPYFSPITLLPPLLIVLPAHARFFSLFLSSDTLPQHLASSLLNFLFLSSFVSARVPPLRFPPLLLLYWSLPHSPLALSVVVVVAARLDCLLGRSILDIFYRRPDKILQTHCCINTKPFC